MSKETGYEAAVNLAVDRLRSVDWVSRCSILGIPAPQNGIIRFRAFGKDLILRLDDFELIDAKTGNLAKVSDRILVLHYLHNEAPIYNTNELITFRQMEGGQFYWEAFLSRSVRPLVERIGNNLDALRNNLGRYEWEPVSKGDLGARIHAIGKVYVTLVYHIEDEEFPAGAEIYFDSSIKRLYPTEDVAVLAGRICIGLL